MAHLVPASRAISRAALALGVAVALSACGSSATHTTTSTTATTTTRPSPSTTTVTIAPTTTTTSTTTPTKPAAAYEPLFPFASLQDLADWEQAGGREHQPWRLDAGMTAIAFANFLGYTEINRVVSVSDDSTGAHVSVGFPIEGGRTSVAAIVHLIRYGSDPNAPWEVVGTDDTTFTLESPPYGATITSPVVIGGHITGVDESISVHVQQLHANGVLGGQCCIAAGGENSPWSATVAFSRPTDPVVIVSASTGGHVQKVERFTVTGVKVS